MHEQVNLDRCTGENILFIRAAGKAVQDSFTRLQAYRATTATICLSVVACPPAMEIFTLAAEAEQAIQTAVKVAWTEREYLWKAHISCDIGLLTSRGTFPSYPFTISDPLLLSPKIPNEFKLITLSYGPIRLTAKKRNLVSTAETFKRGAQRAWTVRWTE